MLLARAAAEQRTIVTIKQLAACGIDSDAITVRLRRESLHRVHLGVYSVGDGVLSLQARFTAAVLACGEGAILSHHAAATHLGIWRWQERRLEVTVPASRAPKVKGLQVHRARGLDRRDVIRHDGIWVTSAARTLLDLAVTMPPKPLRRMIRQAQVEHRVNVRQLLDVLARGNGHPGVTALRAAIADGPTPTASELEDIVLGLIDQATTERPQINMPLFLDGEKIVPDFLWRDRKLVIEADGRRYHDNPTSRADDARRQAILEAHGYRVLRITYDQAVKQPRQTLARIRAALAAAAAC